MIQIVKGSGHTSVWIGSLLITVDWFGYKRMGLKLVDIAWNPD
jgi:hypothetical protein